MARFTQYIGLNSKACKFLHDSKAKEVGTWHMTDGIAFEEVRGKIYEILHKDPSQPCDWIETYYEFEYACPWSSGPMIFTALKNMQSGKILFPWSDEEIANYGV